MITIEEQDRIIEQLYNDEKPDRGIFFTYGEILYYIRCSKSDCNSKEFRAVETKNRNIRIKEETVILNNKYNDGELSHIVCYMDNSVADYMTFSI